MCINNFSTTQIKNIIHSWINLYVFKHVLLNLFTYLYITTVVESFNPKFIIFVFRLDVCRKKGIKSFEIKKNILQKMFTRRLNYDLCTYTHFHINRFFKVKVQTHLKGFRIGNFNEIINTFIIIHCFIYLIIFYLENFVSIVFNKK